MKIGDRVRVLEIPGQPFETEHDCPYETEIVAELIGQWWAVPAEDGHCRWAVLSEHVESLDKEPYLCEFPGNLS